MDARALRPLALWWLRREAARLGWRGLAGIAAGVFAVGFAVSVLWPARHAVVAVKEEVRQVRASLKSGAGTTASPTRAAQLKTFYAFFPAVQSLPDWVGEIHLAAARHGLAMDTGDYQLVRTPGARLQRYEMQLPVKGTYPQVRAFLAEVLKKVPAAALEDVIVRRESVGDPRLEARVRLVIWFGAGA